MVNGYRTRVIGPTVAAIVFGLAFPPTCRAFFFVWPDTLRDQPTTLIPGDTDAAANPPSARSTPPPEQPPVGGPSGSQRSEDPVKVTENPPLVPEPTTGIVTLIGLSVLAAAGASRRTRRPA